MTDFWAAHGWGFLLAATCFPRLTMLCATAARGGLLYWLGWLVLPRFTVAVLATACYGTTNYWLVLATWVVCLLGEGGEKIGLSATVKG